MTNYLYPTSTFYIPSTSYGRIKIHHQRFLLHEWTQIHPCNWIKFNYTLNSSRLNSQQAAALASAIAICYSEVLFRGTLKLYKSGKLLRHYPLPEERHLGIAYLSACSFIVPTALFATFYQNGLQRSWRFNPISIILHTFLYMAIHDVFFYNVHATFHKLRPLYNYFHAMHHEYVYVMNVFIVGYAEIAENSIQVGIPWLVWTYITGANRWNWLLPLSLVVFTTLVGHSGYRMNKWLAILHPLIIPAIWLTGPHMLTPGDHQVHHTHRRYNFGLFWRCLDRWHGTYRKGEMKAHDVYFWTEWLKNKQDNSEQAKKWLGRHAVEFTEVEWGF